MTPTSTPPRDETVARQIVLATRRLRLYRLARDRARAERLKALPDLAGLITSVLARPAGV